VCGLSFNLIIGSGGDGYCRYYWKDTRIGGLGIFGGLTVYISQRIRHRVPIWCVE
jgi:hypothetical protein